MNAIIKKTSYIDRIICFILFIFILTLAACDVSDTDSIIPDDSYEETGSLGFNIQWKHGSGDRKASELSQNCEDLNVENVLVMITKGDGVILASEERPCSDHKATLYDVPVDDKEIVVTVIIQGLHEDGRLLYQGEKGDIIVKAGEKKDAGLILFIPFGSDSAPVIEYSGNTEVDEGETVEITIEAEDLDSDNLIFSVVNPPSNSNFDIFTHTFTWTPSYTDGGDINQEHVVTFEVTDGHWKGEIDVTITVNNVNRPPVIGDFGDLQVPAGYKLEFTVPASDPDEGDTLSYSSDNLPEGYSGMTWATLSETGEFFWHTVYADSMWGTDGDDGLYIVNFIVSDGSDEVEAECAISIGDFNRPPFLSSIGDQQVIENETLVITLSATDSDGDELSYDVDENAPDGYEMNGNVFTWVATTTPEQDVTFSVTDGEFTDSETIIISVISDNVAPVVEINTPTSAANYITSKKTVTLSGSATDNVSDISVVKITGYDDELETDENGNWSKEISLNEGKNTITVTATDDEENDGSDTINIYYFYPNFAAPTSLTYSAATKTLTWEAPYGTVAGYFITGYRIYGGTSSHAYSPDNSITLGNVTTYTFEEAPSSDDIYVSVTAIATPLQCEIPCDTKYESAFSNEVIIPGE